MSDEKSEPATQELVENATETRSRVANDVARLAQQLRPEQLKDRALNAAEHSIESLAARALQRLIFAPRRVLAYVREHPLAGAAIFAGTGVVVWRFVARRQR
jgi:ElaB/YqjD/DUF883 family membrane-anchored ribosome-binding protein